MNLTIIFVLIFFISLILALRSMKDFDAPREIKRIIDINNLKGSIVFFKNKIKHYK